MLNTLRKFYNSEIFKSTQREYTFATGTNRAVVAFSIAVVLEMQYCIVLFSQGTVIT